MLFLKVFESMSTQNYMSQEFNTVVNNEILEMYTNRWNFVETRMAAGDIFLQCSDGLCQGHEDHDCWVLSIFSTFRFTIRYFRIWCSHMIFKRLIFSLIWGKKEKKVFCISYLLILLSFWGVRIFFNSFTCG